MDLNIINELEEKIEKAVNFISVLKEDKQKLERENESLKSNMDGLRTEFEDYKNSSEQKLREALDAKPKFNVDEVKNRLLKLSDKLSTLENSWS